MTGHKMLDKLCKVRRLAQNNPEEKERAAAWGKLAELMAKHEVSAAQLDAYEKGRGVLPAAPRYAQPAPAPFQGGFVVEIDPSSGFGRVFGFGFGFSVNVTGGTGTDSTTTSSWTP
jgi:hypothetical protein